MATYFTPPLFAALNLHCLEPLRNKRYFDNPPAPIKDELKGTAWHPPWPEAEYLARMAKHVPEQVLEIISQMEPTENIRVNEILVDAAIAMPPELSALLVQLTVKWKDNLSGMLLPEKLGNLMEHLARGGQTEEAYQLAQVLLDVVGDPRIVEAPEDYDESIRFTLDSHARIDLWEYGEILKKNFPALVSADGLRAFNLLCDLLDKAIRLEERGETEDYSYIWYPAIDDDEETHRHGVKDYLIPAILDCAKNILQREVDVAGSVFDALERKTFKVFRRIELHLLRLFPQADPHRVRTNLTDRALFDDRSVRHEYSQFAKSQFSALPKEDKGTVLSWIEEGPDIEKFKERCKQWEGRLPSKEEVENCRRQWQLEHLAPICDALPEEWKAKYEDLLAEFGPPPEPSPYVKSTWVGPTSPKTIEELREMALTEIVAFLKEWQPPKEWWFSPSPEGLGRALTTLVEEDPTSYAKDAGLFEGLDPTYVRSVIRGLSNACESDKEFDWNPVLNLCSWAVSQPRELEVGIRRREEGDPHWGWARKTVANLLSSGFQNKSNNIPFTQRATVWAILEPLTEDPDPTPQDEAQDNGSTLDPATESINTVRGEAMHAVVRYALWCRRNLRVYEGEAIERQPVFNELPEVRIVLERHLDPTVDASLAIRSIYGQWLPWLVLMDRDWVASNLERIFPKEPELQSFRLAAWETYVTYCDVYNDVVPLLGPEYLSAVERIGGAKKERLGVGDPEERLAEHLMKKYWMGLTSIDDIDGPFYQFWEKAPSALRAHALDFIGQSLKAAKGDVPERIMERFKVLWANRAEVAHRASSPQDYEEEMAAFGSWFTSRKLEPLWALVQLETALILSGGKAVDAHNIFIHLASYVENFPLLTATCLQKLIEGDIEGWQIRTRNDSIRFILISAIRSDNLEAKQMAWLLINELLRRGFLEFRDLRRD